MFRPDIILLHIVKCDLVLIKYTLINLKQKLTKCLWTFFFVHYITGRWANFVYSIRQFFLSMQILRTHTNLVIAIRQFLYYCQILIFCHNLFMPKQRSKKAKPKIVLTENMYLEVIFQVLQLTHFARFCEFPVYGFTGVSAVL